MPDFELIDSVGSPSGVLTVYKGQRAWLIGRSGPEVAALGIIAYGSSVFWPHWWSICTRHWKRKVLHDRDRVLPKCLWDAPPDFVIPFRSPAEQETARQTLLTLLDFYERLCKVSESAKLWSCVRDLCADDLEYQFRCWALVRVAIAAIAGQEETWNGPQVRRLFRDVMNASKAFRGAVTAASQGVPLFPSDNLALGTTHQTELPQEAPEQSAELDRDAARPTFDDLLDEDTKRMRNAWTAFWVHTPVMSVMFEQFERAAAAVEDAWRSVDRFNIFSDPKKQKVSYLVSRVSRHLNRHFPSTAIANLVRVCDEVARIAYGENVQEAAFKAIGRLRHN